MILRSGSALIQLGALSILFSDCVTFGVLGASRIKVDEPNNDAHSRFVCSSVVHTQQHHLHNLQAAPQSSSYVAPSQAQVTLLPNMSVLLSWNIVRFSDKEILYFIIEYLKTHARRVIATCKLWYKYTADMPTSPYSYVISGLEPDYNYRFRVAAVYGSEKDRTVYNAPSRWLTNLKRNSRMWRIVSPPPNDNPHSLWVAQTGLKNRN